MRQFKGNESFVKFQDASHAVVYSDLRPRQKFLRSCDMITLTVDEASEEKPYRGNGKLFLFVLRWARRTIKAAHIRKDNADRTIRGKHREISVLATSTN